MGVSWLPESAVRRWAVLRRESQDKPRPRDFSRSSTIFPESCRTSSPPLEHLHHPQWRVKKVPTAHTTWLSVVNKKKTRKKKNEYFRAKKFQIRILILFAPFFTLRPKIDKRGLKILSRRLNISYIFFSRRSTRVEQKLDCFLRVRKTDWRFDEFDDCARRAPRALLCIFHRRVQRGW